MPKQTKPLSPKCIAAAQAEGHPVELVDGRVPGLRVRILQNRRCSWSLNIRDSKGIRRRFDIGQSLRLAEARRKAEDLRRAIRDGADPTSDRRTARQRTKAARQGIGTLEALLDTYFRSGPGAEQRRATQTQKLLKTVFNKALGSPILDLDRATLQLIADGWRSPQTAALAVRSIRPCLKWAAKRELAKLEICDLDAPTKARRRERILSADELKAIWPHFEGQHGNVFKWLLWTGCRLNEATGMTWGEVQGDRWTIPGGRTKNKQARVVPLPKQAVEELKALGPRDGVVLVFASARGNALSNWDRETKRIQKHSSTSGWHRHDLRRTVATMLGDLGFGTDVIKVVLGHAHIADGATAVYARSRYQREHQEALQVLADYLDQFCNEARA